MEIVERVFGAGVVLWLLWVAPSMGCSQPDSVVSLGAAELAEKMKYETGILLDVRTPGEWNAGHLQDAILVDFMAADFHTRIQKLDQEKTYYVYCRSGNRSSKASLIMKQMGFKKVYNVKDGYQELKQAGL